MQGNGASPTIWIMISMYLALLMHEAGLIFILTFPEMAIALVRFLFVDDEDLVIFGDKLDTAHSILFKLQEQITHWNGTFCLHNHEFWG